MIIMALSIYQNKFLHPLHDNLQQTSWNHKLFVQINKVRHKNHKLPKILESITK